MKRGLTYIQKILFSVALGALFIFFVVMLLTFTLFDDNKQLQAENDSLQAQYDTLVEYVENEPKYRAEIKENNKQSRGILEAYVPGVRKTSVLHMYEDVLKDYKLETQSLSLNDNVEYASFLLDDDNFKLQTTDIDIGYLSSIKQFMKYIKDLRDSDSNLVIDSASIAYNRDDGGLSGSLVLRQYSVERDTKAYEEPEFNIKTGEKNVFE